MQISNPQELLDRIDKKTLKTMQAKFTKIDRFLGPGDKFQFSCDRTGNCCFNRHEQPIILSVYDVFRLRQHLKVSGKEFSEKYGKFLLGAQSQLPLMILRNEWIDKDKRFSHCTFLKGSDCSVYQNRPQVCRMYPVGRIGSEFNSYFFLTDTKGCCRSGQGKEHTIEDWLEKAEVEPFINWNDKFNKLYMSIEIKKYKKFTNEVKYLFGDIVYDIGNPLENIIGKEKYRSMSKLEDESLLDATYWLASQYVDIILK